MTRRDLASCCHDGAFPRRLRSRRRNGSVRHRDPEHSPCGLRRADDHHPPRRRSGTPAPVRRRRRLARHGRHGAPAGHRFAVLLGGHGAARHYRTRHSLVGFALAAFLTYDITFWTVTVNGIDVRPGNGILLGLLLAVAARALGVPRTREGALWALFLVGFVVGAWALGGSALWFMPALVAAGMWVHRVGDDMTTQSVHGLLYPLFRARLANLPALLGDAGSARERLLRSAMYLYCLYCFIVMVVTGR